MSSSAKQSYTTGGVHVGQAWRAAAETYQTPERACLEAVANLIDNRAARIDIDVEHNTGYYAVTGDGDGTDKQNFDRAMESVYEVKEEADKIGRFKRGFVANTDKSERYLFTATVRGREAAYGYHTWTFDCAGIMASKKDPAIPVGQREDLEFDPTSRDTRKDARRVWWRTRLEVFKFSKRQRSFVSIDDLWVKIKRDYHDAIRSVEKLTGKRITFSIRMVDEKGIAKKSGPLHIEAYGGSPLPKRVIKNEAAGSFSFDLYLAKIDKGRHIGKVTIGSESNIQLFPIENFVHKVGKKLSHECSNALVSGVFEGSIRASKAELHPNRESFCEDDIVEHGIIAGLEEWYLLVAKSHMDAIRSAKEDARTELYGAHALDFIERLKEDPDFSDLVNSLEQQGSGYTKDKDGDTMVVQPDKKKSDRDPGRDTSSKKKPKKGKKPVKASTAKGPNGERGRKVEVDGLNFHIEYHYMEEFYKIYDYIPSQGRIIFNQAHPHWKQCGDNLRRIVFLQNCHIMEIVMLNSFQGQYRDLAEQYAERYRGGLSYLIASCDSLDGAFPVQKLEKVQKPDEKMH
jgi:hypothetical protein